MATTEQLRLQPHDRPVRRRPFSNWMKKLANFKGSSSTDSSNTPGSKRNDYPAKSHSKKNNPSKNNNPYMTSGNWNGSLPSPSNGHLSFSTAPTGRTTSTTSLDRSRRSFRSSDDGVHPTADAESNAARASTDAEFGHSDAARSHGASSGKGTTATVGDGPSTGRGPDSTFSSPAPSLRSLTTTLTTVHSNAAPAAGTGQSSTQAGGQGGNGNYSQSIHFTHQFPTSPPATALPAHLAPQGSGGHPATYNTATANNLLTDNASILTLASSSKRRRRRSFDTDASVRALAPSSLFGGSRESLPLSILSSNIDFGSSIPAPGLHTGRTSGGVVNERASIYSATGVAPTFASDRNSFYAGKQSIVGDGGSIKSGLLGHGRTDSISGSIAGIGATGTSLVSPREPSGGAVGKISRSNSGWGETSEEPAESAMDRAKGKGV